MIIAAFMIIPGCLGDSGESTEILGTEYRDPPDAPDFTLFDQNGDIFRFSDHDGKVIVVAFVYTACPDICLIISIKFGLCRRESWGSFG